MRRQPLPERVAIVESNEGPMLGHGARTARPRRNRKWNHETRTTNGRAGRHTRVRNETKDRRPNAAGVVVVWFIDESIGYSTRPRSYSRSATNICFTLSRPVLETFSALGRRPIIAGRRKLWINVCDWELSADNIKDKPYIICRTNNNNDGLTNLKFHYRFKNNPVRIDTDVLIQRYCNNIVIYIQWRCEHILYPKSSITKLPPSLFHIFLVLSNYKRRLPRSTTILFARHSCRYAEPAVQQ